LVGKEKSVNAEDKRKSKRLFVECESPTFKKAISLTPSPNAPIQSTVKPAIDSMPQNNNPIIRSLLLQYSSAMLST
jgi:hypothetical protein